MVSVCLPSDALLQHLPSYLNFFYLGRGVSLHGCSSKAQPLLLTLDEGYLLPPLFLTFNMGWLLYALLHPHSHHSLDVRLPLPATAPSLGRGVAAPRRCPGLGRGVAPSCCRPWPPELPLASDAWWLLPVATPSLRCGVSPPGSHPRPRTQGSSSWPFLCHRSLAL